MLSRHIRLVSVSLWLGVFSSGALAQKAPAVDPAAITAAKELMVAMGADEQFDTVIETMTNGMSAMVRQKQPGKAKEIDEVFAKMAAKFKSRKSDMIEMTAPLYAEKFSVAEMGEIGAFYDRSKNAENAARNHAAVDAAGHGLGPETRPGS
jgi:uncharacterized protein